MTKVLAFLDKKFFPVMTNDFGKLSERFVLKSVNSLCAAHFFSYVVHR